MDSRPPKSRTTRFLAAAALLAAGYYGVETFLLEPLLRSALARLPAQGGPALVFKRATGSLREGSFRLSDASITGVLRSEPSFTLRVPEVDLDLAMLDALQGRTVIERLRARGPGPGPPPPSPSEACLDSGPGPSDAGTFRLRVLEVETTPLAFQGHEAQVARLDVCALRSDWALHDLMFRARGRGGLDGGTFAVDPGDGAEVTWTGRDLPAERWAPHFKGILSWLTAGTIDAIIRCRVPEPSDSAAVKTQWTLTLRDLEMAVPDTAKSEQKHFLGPALRQLFRDRKEIDLSFRFEIPLQEFRDAGGLKALHLGRRVSKAAGEKLEGLAGELMDDLGGGLGEVGRLAVRRMMDKMQRKRGKKRSQETADNPDR